MSRHRTPPVELFKHPPERGKGGCVVLPCGCCCCCCCCLHSVGSLVGGPAGSAQKIDPPPRPVDPDFPFPYRRDEIEQEGPIVPAGVLYWLLVCFGLGLVAAYYVIVEAHRRLDDWFIGMLVGLFFLPAVQLGASLVAWLVILIFYADRTAALMRLGRITVWSFVGALIGSALMFVGCGGFGLLR